MNAFKIRSDEEAKTHELMDGFEYEKMFSTVQCVKQVFRAQWAFSLRAESILPLAQLLSNSQLEEGDVKKVLSLMVRRKVLRTRIQSGDKFYEVNY